jgi:NADH-quinone oxidoreductase subunit J
MIVFEDIIIILSGLAAIAGAITMVMQANPVRAALGLLLSLASVGVMFLSMGAHFLGFIQLMIYAGAIVILFLFAIMNFPLGKLRRDKIPSTRLIGWVLIMILVSILLGDLVVMGQTGALNLPFAVRQFDDTLRIGKELVYNWTYPFELIGVLLLVAVVASMHLTRRDESDEHKEDQA